MIMINYDRGNFWLRLKLLLTLGGKSNPNTPTPKLPAAAKRQSHRCKAFFEMP